MSRIRRIGYALADKQTPNTVRQAFRLREQTLKVVDSANEFASTSRRITKRAAFTVVLRSLEKTKGLPFSLREHLALKDLSTYINLAQHNKADSFTHSHTDLLPVSHPRSTRLNSLSASALREAHARWYSDDSRITNETARAVLASAFTALPGSAEHLYYTSLLSGLPQGTVPTEALLAAFGDGNSSAARRERAMRQRRDRKGRFAYEGGGLRALIRRLDGKVFSLTGRTVAQGEGDNIQIELPDGRIAEVPASRGEFVKAVLPTPDGYSPREVKPSISEEGDVIDEKDIKFVDAPAGWSRSAEREQDNVWEDGAFLVDITEDADGNKNFAVYNKDDMENPLGQYKNWAEVQDSLRDNEEVLAKPKARLPKPEDMQAPAAEKPETFEFNYPAGAYKIKPGAMYEAEGRIDEESTNFTDDPAELAQMFDPRDIKAALEEAIIPQGENENAFGYGNLGFNRGDEMVDANALYNALKEQDEDADMELARIYDEALGGTANQDALNDFRKQPEQVAGETPALEESFKRMLEEGVADVAPAAEEPNFDPAEMDMVPLPPVLEGLGDAEMKQFMETKDHTPFLPDNDDVEPPVGYNKLNPAPFTSWREVTADNPDPVLPEGFSDNPVFLAQSVPQADLEAELRRALEPGNEMPGYGAIKLQTEDGEEFVANVPGEAIRDALQLNGVDTNKLIEDIYNEGEAQRVNEDLARQILDQEEGQVAEMPSVLDMLEEEEALADKYEEEGDGMPRGDAQAVAEAEMRRKYGKSAMDALLELDPKEGARLLDLRERKILGELDVPQRTVEVRKKTLRPELIQDFEVGALEEVPDGIAEYPKPADIAPANANAPYRIVSKVTDLQPGDITVGDHFVITEIGEKVPGTDRRKIKGYYPGHVEQDTKQWNEWREIEVIRGAQAPEKGDLPVLSKPKPQDFGKQKRGADGKWDFVSELDKALFLEAQAAYDAQLAEAKKGFIDPTSPSNQPHRTIVRAADLQPGDISADPKKGHFVIERIFTDENTKPGFVSIEGYYPGHVTQRKEWKVDTQIDVYRNVEPPAKGDLPELHQPHLVVNGKWRPDKDPAKRAEYEKQIAELANVWQAPENLPVVENKEQKAEENKDIPDAVVVARPKPPRMVEMPAFQGDAAGLMREAGGDWNKFKELLADKNLVFFDFETTGVNEEDGNEPWQVAAVKIRNGEVVDRVNIFMNPGRSIADTYAGRDTDGIPNAVDADGNKLTDEFLAQQPTQEEAMRQLIEWMGPDYILGAQNMAFDDEVARRMADKFGIDYNPAGYIDTLPMAKDIYKDQPKEDRPKTPKGRESYALGNLAKHLGIDLENWHAADADAEAAAKIFNALIEKGIELDAGKDLFDVDARNDEYVAKLDDYNIALANYETDIANYAAAKALKDGLEGKPLDVENLVALSKGVAGQDPDNVNIGPVGLEPEVPQAVNEKVVLDFTPNADFPKGKMLLMPKDWALDDNNTVLLDREDARMRDLLPGDFMQSKDGEIVWQVVAVRAGEDFGLAPGRVKVYRRNVDTGEISTYEHWHGTRLDGVRRPINPAALNAPEGEEVFVANAPENPVEIEQKSEPGNVVYRNLIDIGGLADGYVRIRKNEEGRFEAIVGIVDNNDEAVFSFKEDYRTYEGAKAEAEAILQERAQEFLAQKRDEAAEPAEARAKDVPISRGDIPADAGIAAQLIEVENLPNDLVGNISIRDIGEEQPKFEAEAALQNAEGDVIAEQFSEHKNKAAAEKEGRDFIARAADAVQNPEPVEAPASKPKKKELSEADKRVLKQNEWVEANAGRLAPLEANAVKPGDFFWNAFHKRYEEVLETKYIGFMNRYEFKVFNVKNGKEEIRYFEADSPLRNMRRPGIEDQEVVIEDDKAAPRGGKRRDIKRKALEERIVAKEGRAMGGNFEKEGFYRDRNGNPIRPDDLVIHNNPEKAKKYGVGKVVRRVGAQVEEGKKVGGLGRAGVVYLDYVEVDFPDGVRRKFKTRMLIKQNAPEAEVERQKEEFLPPPPTPPFPRVGEEAPPALDVKFENIDNAEITDGLQKIRDAAENKNRRAGNATIERAVEAVDNFLRGLDINNADKIKMDELDAAIRRFARKGYDQEASALEGLRDLIKPQVNKLQAEKIARIYADINNPLEVALNDVDTLDFNNVIAVLEEIQNRLPDGERDSVGRRLGYAREYIDRLKGSISDNDDLMETFDYDLLKEAVNYINEAGLQPNAPQFDNIKNRLNEVEAAVKGYRKKNRKPFGKKNMPEIDPIALAEQRVQNGDNKVTVQDFDHIKAGILDDDVFAVNQYLAPYKQELQDFFGTDGDKPLAALSADARQALSQYVSDEIRKISGVRDGDRKQSLANQYSKMLLALHDEKLAFNPNRSDLGPVGEALKDIDFNAVFQFGQSQATKKPKKLVINGQDTGFKIQKIGDGINQSYNYRLIHSDTGQIFYFKRERSLNTADAEFASNQLARALNIAGVPVVERHNNDAQVLIMTNAGDSLNYDKDPFVAGFAGQQYDDVASRAAIADMIGVAILDAVIYNTDRHTHNFLLGEVDRGNVGSNGREELQILPIDHGFAQLFVQNVRVEEPVDYMSGRDGRDGGYINKALAKQLGAVTYKELIDMTVQQAIQAIERGDYLANVTPRARQDIIDRLLTLKGIDADKWKTKLAKKL